MVKLKNITLNDRLGLKDGLKYSIEGPVTGIYLNDKVLGYINYISHSSLKIIYIDTMELFDQYKGKGYGTLAINELKKMYSDYAIHGQCTPYDNSKNFWENQGAIFDSCCSCTEYNICGGDIYNGHCDVPMSYSFEIPNNL